jgi:murein DD-endopeptidase MepM/ murein hydrolase activator NlpD
MAVVTSEFGKRPKPCPTCSDDHKGIDLRAPVGSPIYANQNLQVSRVVDNGDLGYGKALYVKNPNDPSKEYIFGHLDDNNPGGYKVGQTIPAGSLMGYSGATGVNASPHVHYEVRKNGVPIPPRDDTGIASFEKNNGNLLTSSPKVEKNRPTKPETTPPPGKTLPELQAAREREKNKTGPGSNPRPRPNRSDTGILINPRHMLNDGG